MSYPVECERYYNLRRCGCRRCQDEADNLARDRYRYCAPEPYGVADTQMLKYISGVQSNKTKIITRPLTQIGEYTMTTTPAVVPAKPVDPAIKAILDRRALVQSTFDNQTKTVASYEARIKENNATIVSYAPSLASGKVEIAALNKALKKLGHDE